MGKIKLEDEIICDYLVTKKMKEVWQCELDMLEEVDRICKKNKIKYFLQGGTLLGAVRHKGYIPWDDDIDIVMKRNDYNKFLKVAQEELNNKYFLQYYKTEKMYNRGHAQIRNSNTTAIIKIDKYNNFNKGIFIDIFPLDNIPNDKKEADKFIKKLKKMKKILNAYYNLDSSNIFKKIIKRILHSIIYKFINYEKEINKFEEFVSKYKDEDTEFIAALSFWPESPKYKNEHFEETILMDFEYLKLPCPREYDEVLKMDFGDYMKIPENKGGTVHGEVFFDTQKSYKEYEKSKK